MHLLAHALPHHTAQQLVTCRSWRHDRHHTTTAVVQLQKTSNCPCVSLCRVWPASTLHDPRASPAGKPVLSPRLPPCSPTLMQAMHAVSQCHTFRARAPFFQRTPRHSFQPPGPSSRQYNKWQRFPPVKADLLGQGSMTDPSDTWERLHDLNQQLEAAVQKEDFKLAAQLRDQCKVLKDQLSPVQQYQYYQVQLLRTGTPEERNAAINALRETGSASCLPQLATCLHEPSLNAAADAAMWSIFTRSAQPRTNELLQQGMRFMTNGNDLQRALEVFDQVIRYEPSFAEGYNKRATVLYLMGRFQDSIDECHSVLSINPYHFGAASGMGLCYMQMRHFQEALNAFERALRINPGMQQVQQYVQVLQQQLAEVQSEE